jgi:hypothetical protein
MSRRLDIEITSVNGPSATWRAAGAREPKGVLATADVNGGVTVGQIFRAEIEQYMEGVEIISLSPPRAASPVDPRHERITLLAPAKPAPDVQVTYAGKGRRAPSGDQREKRASRGERPERRERPDRSGRPPRSKPSADAERTARPERRERPRRPRETHETGSPDATSPERPADRTRPVGRGGPKVGSSPRPPARRAPSRDRATRIEHPPVATVNRNSFLATLPSEQLPIAEELLRGGLPAVRRALEEQNRNAAAQSRPPANAEAILRIAEELLGRANLAFWKDRASGASSAGAELRLRDLRAVVTSAKTVPLDDEARAQLRELQASLTARVNALRDEWTAKLNAALERSDVDESLRLSIRTPEPTARVGAEAAARVAALASSALTAESNAEAWRATVRLAVDSPMRRLIKPAGIPDNAECRELALHSAGAIPEFAKLLGMKVPPPPPAPARPPRRPTVNHRSS